MVGGLIVDGGIYRYEFVSSGHRWTDACADGYRRSGLFCGTDTARFFSEGQPEFFREHFVTKGVEAAHARVGDHGAETAPSGPDASDQPALPSLPWLVFNGQPWGCFKTEQVGAAVHQIADAVENVDGSLAGRLDRIPIFMAP